MIPNFHLFPQHLRFLWCSFFPLSSDGASRLGNQRVLAFSNLLTIPPLLRFSSLTMVRRCLTLFEISSSTGPLNGLLPRNSLIQISRSTRPCSRMRLRGTPIPHLSIPYLLGTCPMMSQNTCYTICSRPATHQWRAQKLSLTGSLVAQNALALFSLEMSMSRHKHWQKWMEPTVLPGLCGLDLFPTRKVRTHMT